MTPPRQPQGTVQVFWCPACGWDDHAWGGEFWQRHYEPGEHREPGLPCLNRGGAATKLAYNLRRAAARALDVSRLSSDDYGP